MKNGSEKRDLSLAILLSFLLIGWSFYAPYDLLIGSNFLSSHPTFEKADMEGPVTDTHDCSKIFVQSASPVICFSGSFFMDQLPHLFSPVPSSHPSISVLRC
jgi:hypothetical protein